MTALGVDVAQGGSDLTVLAARHGGWFARLKTYRGVDTHDGPSVAGLIFMQLRDAAEVVLDMGGGYGGSAYDHLKQTLSPTAFNAAAAGPGRDRSGTLSFRNLRAAGLALGHVGFDPRPLVPLEDAVDEGGHAFRFAAHSVLRDRACRRSARPRWIRDITVPTGISSIWAISA